MNINLTPIFQAIIALVAALITYRLIPWIQAKTTNEQQQIVKAVVRTLVFAAEQMYGAGHGADKLTWVQNQLAAAGFDVDVADIEATVYEEINFLRNTAAKVEEPADVSSES